MTGVGHNSRAEQDERLIASMKRLTIGAAISAWLAANPDWTAARLANSIGCSRQQLCDAAKDRTPLADRYIPRLPLGLREQVAELRAQQYEAIAEAIRQSGGVQKKFVQGAAQ